MRAKISFDVERAICASYALGDSQEKIAQENQISQSSVWRVLMRNGISKRSPSEFHSTRDVNHNCFDDLENPDAAYWAGFLYADGSVTSDRNSNHRKFQISLKVSDVNHLEKFKNFLGSNHKISFGSKTGYGDYGYCHLSITSDKICEKMFSFGITSPRTSLPNMLKRSVDFWRGAIDGDGWITKDNRPRYAIGLCGELDIVTDFCEFCKIYVPECKTAPVKTKSIYKIQYQGKYFYPIANLIYSGANTFLDRKKNKALEFMKLCLQG